MGGKITEKEDKKALLELVIILVLLTISVVIIYIGALMKG